MIATGLTGTIGRHLPIDTKALKINLAGEKKIFDSIEFKTEETLIHLAGIVGSSQVNKDENYAIKVNIEGTNSLAQEFSKNQTRNLYMFPHRMFMLQIKFQLLKIQKYYQKISMLLRNTKQSYV